MESHTVIAATDFVGCIDCHAKSFSWYHCRWRQHRRGVLQYAPTQYAPTGDADIADWYLGQSPSYHVWLIYRPDLDWLKSRDAALTLTLAEKIATTAKDKRHLVFAPARFVASKHLLPLGVEHAPLPFALYRFEK